MKSPDEARKKLTAQWLQKATKDLTVGRFLHQKGKMYFDFACFHSQQCAEKAIKGFLVWHGTPFRKIHDLVELGALCVAIDSSLEKPLKRTDSLSRYAVDARYPGEDDTSYTAAQTRFALERAEKILEHILARIPELPQKSARKSR